MKHITTYIINFFESLQGGKDITMRVITVNTNDNRNDITSIIYDQLNDYNRYSLEDEFNEVLDDSHEPIELFGIEYSSSRALKELDYYRYEESLDEYIWGIAEGYAEELDDCEEVEVYNVTYKKVNA